MTMPDTRTPQRSGHCPPRARKSAHRPQPKETSTSNPSARYVGRRCTQPPLADNVGLGVTSLGSQFYFGVAVQEVLNGALVPADHKYERVDAFRGGVLNGRFVNDRQQILWQRHYTGWKRVPNPATWITAFLTRWVNWSSSS